MLIHIHLFDRPSKVKYFKSNEFECSSSVDNHVHMGLSARHSNVIRNDPAQFCATLTGILQNSNWEYGTPERRILCG